MSPQYPGVSQTAASVVWRQDPTEGAADESDHSESECDQIASVSYLRATMDLEAHLILQAHINSISTLALIDSRATGIFMHPSFAQQCKAKIRQKVRPREVRVIDGRIINSGLMTQEATFQLQIGDHREECVADITNIGRYPCILGTPWLVHHDPTI